MLFYLPDVLFSPSPSLSLSISLLLYLSLQNEDTVLGGAKKVDVDAVPTIGGQTLFEIDLDSADKPWRLPGIAAPYQPPLTKLY